MYELSESTLYHLYLRNEIRRDGWKSEWRKELERRNEEEKLRREIKRAA